jgi:hypothetical protein
MLSAWWDSCDCRTGACVTVKCIANMYLACLRFVCVCVCGRSPGANGGDGGGGRGGGGSGVDEHVGG